MNLIDRINNESNIVSFANEDILRAYLPLFDTNKLNWMRIFNSDMQLSSCFITEHINEINWNWLMRPLPEAVIDRYHKQVVQWNVQMYAPTRTIEFVMKYQNNLNWEALSQNLPQWFNEYHVELFEDKLNWKHITSRVVKTLHPSILYQHIYDLDWEWITVNYIPDEQFAQTHINRILWDHPQLNTNNLSTEFLYDITDTRRIAFDMNRSQKKLNSDSEEAADMHLHGKKLAQGFNPSAKVRIGATVGFKFFCKHWKELDIGELERKQLITKEMIDFMERQSDSTSSTDSTFSIGPIEYDSDEVMCACI